MASKLWAKYFVVRYAWVERGIEKRAHTVASGLSLEDAEQTFARENPHVAVVRSLVVPEDPSSAPNIAARIEGQRIKLDARDDVSFMGKLNGAETERRAA